MKQLFLLLLLSSALFAQYSPANYCADVGASDAYACNLSPSPIAYVTGTTYFFKANTANTGAATINFNGIGAKTIVKVAGGITTTLADNDILVGQIVELSYDGTNMQMQSLLGNAPGGGSGGTAGSPLAVQTSSVTVTSNTESTLIGTVVGSKTIPANWFTSAGAVMEVCASGIMTTAAAAQGTVQFKLKFGSTVVAQTTAYTPSASLSNNAYDFCARLTARTIGASGTIMATNILPTTGASIITANEANLTNPTPGTAVTVDTTATQVVDFTVTFSANATNSITQTNFYMVGPGSAVSSVNGLTGAVTGLSQRIAQTILSSTAATVTLSSIPGSYTNLRLVVQARCDSAVNSDDMYIQFNADTGNNYSRQFLVGNNTTVAAGQNISTGKVGPAISCASAISGAAASITIDIPNYSGATFNKIAVIKSFYVNGGSLSGNLDINNYGVYWANTAAITSVVVGLTGGSNFISGSVFTLYGE